MGGDQRRSECVHLWIHVCVCELYKDRERKTEWRLWALHGIALTKTLRLMISHVHRALFHVLTSRGQPLGHFCYLRHTLLNTSNMHS